MAWEPITLGEDDVRSFADQAIQFCDALDDQDKALWHQIVDRAGGDGHQHGRGDGSNAGAGATVCSREHFVTALGGIWEPGITIAPLYSGAMPSEGGGTVD